MVGELFFFFLASQTCTKEVYGSSLCLRKIMAEKHHSTKVEQERESEGAEEGKEEKEKEGRGGGEAEARAGNQEEKQNKQKQKKPPVNKRAMCICLCIFYTCFHITIADVSSCDRDQFTIWLFTENVC